MEVSALDTAARPRVTVVVPAYGRTALLKTAVESLHDQDLPGEEYEVIVVDSSPDDRNQQMVDSLRVPSGCSVTCLRKSAEGPGPSRNLGARSGRAPVIAFMDSDCQAGRGWLRAGLAAFDDGVGIVQGKVLPVPGAPHNIFNRTLRVEAESFLYETANIFYRRDAFEQAGGFPASELSPNALFPFGGEDVALAWGVKRAGWQTRFSAEALVLHVVFRITPWQWLVDKHMYICPRIVRDFPETRRFFYRSYFFDRVQAALVLGLVSAAAAVLSSGWAGVGILPYLWVRGSEPTVALRGPLRLLRVGFYLPRDLISLALLAAGSLRFRALLL